MVMQLPISRNRQLKGFQSARIWFCLLTGRRSVWWCLVRLHFGRLGTWRRRGGTNDYSEERSSNQASRCRTRSLPFGTKSSPDAAQLPTCIWRLPSRVIHGQDGTRNTESTFWCIGLHSWNQTHTSEPHGRVKSTIRLSHDHSTFGLSTAEAPPRLKASARPYFIGSLPLNDPLLVFNRMHW